MEKAQRADGVVVALVDRGRATSPTIQFQPAQDAQPVRFTVGWSTEPPIYRVGEAVSVLFDPANPQDADIQSSLGLWWVVYLLAGMGVLFVGLSALIRFAAR